MKVFFPSLRFTTWYYFATFVHTYTINFFFFLNHLQRFIPKSFCKVP